MLQNPRFVPLPMPSPGGDPIIAVEEIADNGIVIVISGPLDSLPEHVRDWLAAGNTPAV